MVDANVRHDDKESDFPDLPSGEVLGYVARTTVLADEAIELLERGETDRAIAAIREIHSMTRKVVAT